MTRMFSITERDGVRTVNLTKRTGVVSEIGEIIACEDGEYVFFPKRDGFLRTWILHEIVQELDGLNLAGDETPGNLSILS